MKSNLFKSVALATALALAIGPAFAQSITIPQVTQINASDLFQDVVNGVPTAGKYYAPASLLGNLSTTYAGNNPENAIIGGDATTNLFQRATSGSSVTTTVTYGGPDRWAYWSGTNTAMTVSRDTTAADLPSNYQAAFKMARTSGQTGVVQMCMAQEVETVNSIAFQGQTAEIDAHIMTGANFSGTGVTLYLISGTGTDQGIAGSASMANGLNSGGGGSASWTGQVNTGVAFTIPAGTSSNRYTAAIPVPSGATELGVAICYTPVGTAGTNDYIAVTGIQLTRNSALASVAGTAGAALSTNDPRAKAFARRTQALETLLQQRYTYYVTEVTGPSVIAMCRAHSVTVAECYLQFPVTMRAAPTLTYTNGFATETTAAGGTLGACSGVATATTVASTAPSTQGVFVACTATTVPAAGVAGALYNNGGSGVIKASAEL